MFLHHAQPARLYSSFLFGIHLQAHFCAIHRATGDCHWGVYCKYDVYMKEKVAL